MLTVPSMLAQARAPFALIPLLLAAFPTQAADTTISNASTTAQAVTAHGALTVTSAGSLTVGGKTPAVSVSGGSATVSNLGTIYQTGTGRALVDTAATPSLVINNGSAANATALMKTANGDVVQLGNFAGESVELNNWGQMISLNPAGGGSQVVDFSGITSGRNVINNKAGGLMLAAQADAVRPGVDGVVNNDGIIRSTTPTGSSSDGVDGQDNTGITVNNGGTVEGARHGITGGPKDATLGYTIRVVNALNATIQGDNGSGMNIDGFNAKEVARVENHGTIVGNGVTGDGDGVDVDGLVTLINTGVIRSLNAVDPAGAFSEGLSVGGGSITNSGTIEGLVAANNPTAKGIGITLTGNDIASGSDKGNRDGLYGNAVVHNQDGGLIRGQNSSAIVAKGLPSGNTVVIGNDATSTLRGGGSTDAAIQLGADAAAIDNAGLIDGSSSQRAIQGGAGNLTLTVTGGQARILGDIAGGTGHNTLEVDAGAGNSFAYASGISGFDRVEVASGTATLSGKSTYTGTTVIDTGARLVLAGAGRLAAGSSLDLEGGTLRLVGVGGANGEEFAVLTVGQDSAIELGASSITFDALGNVVTGKLAVTDWLASASPGYALRFLGDLTRDAGFLALMGDTTIDGLAVRYRFDGRYTDVTAVPEPANVALLLAGLALLGATPRRRARP